MNDQAVVGSVSGTGTQVQFGTAIPMWLVMREASRGNHRGIARVIDAFATQVKPKLSS